MKKSVYRKAAEELFYSPYLVLGCCWALSEAVASEEEEALFQDYFKYTHKNDEPGRKSAYWMGMYDERTEDIKNRRILALLLMEQIEKDKKLRR